jgi:hypothetical protein
MKFILILILFVLSCKDTDSKESKNKLIMLAIFSRVQVNPKKETPLPAPLPLPPPPPPVPVNTDRSCYTINVPSDTPECIKNKIQNLLVESITKPPATAISNVYKNEKVFQVTGNACCDQGGVIFNKQCEVICATIGFTGEDDGRCTDFSTAATQRTVIWEDKRNASGGCK